MTRALHSISMLKSFRTTLLAAVAVAGLSVPASADFIMQTNLVTNDPIGHPAQITDSNLVNAWGMSYGATSPIWVSDNGAGVATIYTVDPTTNAVTKAKLTVSIPGDGSVDGQAFNTGAGSGAFNGDAFLFTNEDGTISGWRGALGTSAEVLQAGSTSNLYKGTTVVTMGGHTYLYAANFASGHIDVLKGDVGAPSLTGSFNDPTLPAGYAPFNVQTLGGHIFVTYGLQVAGSHDEAHGAGLGIVNEFDTNGNFIARVGTHGALDAPWGLAIAPSSFGAMAGDLLVGNFGDGHINIFNMMTDQFMGQLMAQNGTPLTIEGLWGLIPGNGGSGGNPMDLYFSAGPNDESNGLFGSLSFVPEPASILLLASGLLGFAWRRRWSAAS